MPTTPYEIWFEHYRKKLLSEPMSLAERVAMLRAAFDRDQLDRDHFLRLLDLPVPDLMVNSLGGDA